MKPKQVMVRCRNCGSLTTGKWCSLECYMKAPIEEKYGAFKEEQFAKREEATAERDSTGEKA